MSFNLRRIRLGGPATGREADMRTVPSTLSSSRPGMLIVLIDQSYSMRSDWGTTGRPRMDIAAEYVNKMIDRVLQDSQKDNIFSPRIWIALFGYSNRRDDPTYTRAVRLLANGWPADFADRTGGWVDPVADGATLMSLPFIGARRYLEQFFSEDAARRDQFAMSAPAVILNITDGEANEFEKEGDRKNLENAVERIWSFPMPNGFAPLVFHVQISDKQDARVVLPSSDKGLDSFGRELFRLSSEIPASWISQSSELFTPRIEAGAVGLMSNAGPEELMKMLTLASRPAGER